MLSANFNTTRYTQVMPPKPITQFDYTVRIITPLSPGVFTATHQQAILDACLEMGVHQDTVSSVGMVGREVVSLSLTLTTAIAQEERPEHLTVFTNLDDVIASKAKEERWEAIKRVIREMTRRDNSIVPYAEKVK